MALDRNRIETVLRTLPPYMKGEEIAQLLFVILASFGVTLENSLDILDSVQEELENMEENPQDYPSVPFRSN